MVEKYAVVIVDDVSTEAKVILKNNYLDACKDMERLYYECLFHMYSYDFNNTFIEEDLSYSQIVDGLNITRFYVTKVKTVEKSRF